VTRTRRSLKLAFVPLGGVPLRPGTGIHLPSQSRRASSEDSVCDLLPVSEQINVSLGSPAI
jgi:hypothetical protein